MNRKATPASWKPGNIPWNKGLKYKTCSWSRDYEKCISCGTKDRPHNAGGLCKSCYYKTDKAHVVQKKYRDKRKLEVMRYYCKGEPKCMCCGENEIKFLGIDHINGCGTKRRKKEPSGSPIIIYLKSRGYPEGYQVLCHNCNMAKGHYGKCPHEDTKTS